MVTTGFYDLRVKDPAKLDILLSKWYRFLWPIFLRPTLSVVINDFCYIILCPLITYYNDQHNIKKCIGTYARCITLSAYTISLWLCIQFEIVYNNNVTLNGYEYYERCLWSFQCDDNHYFKAKITAWILTQCKLIETRYLLKHFKWIWI